MPQRAPISVAVLAFDRTSLFHLSVTSLVLGGDRRSSGLPLYEVRYVGLRKGTIRTADGLEIRVNNDLAALADAALVVVPTWSDPEQRAPQALVQALQEVHARGVPVISLCLGAFVLGDAGLLDGRAATTHWAWSALFSQRYPHTEYRADVLYVSDDRVITSAGSVAAIDCCLNFVREQHGAEVANQIARRLVTPPHRQGGQAQFVSHPVPTLPSETRLAEVLAWARNHIHMPLTLDMLAERAHLSRRTFTRRFREVTGTTVVKWLTKERVLRAQQLLETTDLPVEQIATAAGFGSVMSLRQCFTSQLTTSPSTYRRMFRAAHHHEAL